MGALGIPGVINNFNLYNNGTALVGLTGEISLPDFEGMTETLSGPGILGEIEEVIIGQFGSMELEIPFRILDEDAFKLMSPATSLNLTLRASEQFTVKSTGGIDYKPYVTLEQINDAFSDIDDNKTGISNLQDDTAKTKGKPSLQAQLDALEKRVKALGG